MTNPKTLEARMFLPITLQESEHIFSLFRVFVRRCAVGDSRSLREKHSVFVKVLYPEPSKAYVTPVSRERCRSRRTRGCLRSRRPGVSVTRLRTREYRRTAHPRIDRRRSLAFAQTKYYHGGSSIGDRNDSIRPPGWDTTARRTLRTLRLSNAHGLRRAPVSTMREYRLQQHSRVLQKPRKPAEQGHLAHLPIRR